MSQAKGMTNFMSCQLLVEIAQSTDSRQQTANNRQGLVSEVVDKTTT